MITVGFAIMLSANIVSYGKLCRDMPKLVICHIRDTLTVGPIRVRLRLTVHLSALVWLIR
jgi:hypothetical protein